MDIAAYLRRIGYEGPRTPTPAVLSAIARHHAMAIPFENVSVLVDGPPDLDLDALERKLVHARRGGYCYEQNSLLRAALDDLGFQVRGLSARVRYGIPNDVMTPRSHMVLCVDLPDGQALVDAGFGGLTLTAPVMMRWHEVQKTSHEAVRLVPDDEDRVLQAELGGEWIDVYRFDFSRHLPPDYVQQNWHTATRPNGLFANNLIAAVPAQGGRYALFNRTLTWRSLAGEKERRQIESQAALRSTLQEVFSIEVSDRELAKAWEVSGRVASLHPGFS